MDISESLPWLCVCVGVGVGVEVEVGKGRSKVGREGRKEAKVANFGGRLGFMFVCLSVWLKMRKAEQQDIWMTRRTRSFFWPPLSATIVASYSLA